MVPKKSSLSTLSNEALCKLRDEIAELLENRADALRKELDRVTGGEITVRGDKMPRARRRKATPKYQGPDGETWAGRGVRPRWLTGAIQAGKKLEDFLIEPHSDR
jgi:DNA-binding protein H-NS